MSLDDRLRRLAHHIDTELTTGHSGPSTEQTPVVELYEHRQNGSRPRLAAVAAAAVITVGAGGLAVASWTRDSTPATGTAPASSSLGTDDTTTPAEAGQAAEQRPRLPTVYPAVDQQIDGATEAEGSYSMVGYENPLRVEALIAIVSDTALTGGIQIQAVAGSDPVESTQTTRETVEVWGREADVYTEPGTPRIKTVVIDVAFPSVATTLRFTGLDPLAVLEASEEFVQVVPIPPADDSGSAPFTLEFGSTLPDGYEIVNDPTAPANGAVIGSLLVNNTASVEGNLIQVSTINPLAFFAAAGPLTAVEVNGTPGWMSDGPGHAVIWPVNDATYAIVGGNATTDEASTVANTVTFIDEATWRDRYNVPEPDFGHPSNLPASTATAAPSIPEPSTPEPATTVTVVLPTTTGP